MPRPEPRGGGASPGELDELTLVRAQRGEEPAARALVQAYERRVFALLSRLLGPSGRAHLVEDLAQETFLRVFRALPEFDRAGRARLSTWVLTIATRLALDELKRQAPRVLPLDDAAQLAVAPETAGQGAERRSLAAAVTRAVAALSADQRAAFLLREVHELTYEEIAAALGIDLGTVKSRIARAKIALRAALAEVHDG